MYLAVGEQARGALAALADAVVVHRVRERARGYANMSEVEAALAKRSRYALDAAFRADARRARAAALGQGLREMRHAAAHDIMRALGDDARRRVRARPKPRRGRGRPAAALRHGRAGAPSGARARVGTPPRR